MAVLHRTPSGNAVEEIKWRLAHHKSPSFDREAVETLIAEIDSLKSKIQVQQKNSDAAGAEHVALCDAIASGV